MNISDLLSEKDEEVTSLEFDAVFEHIKRVATQEGLNADDPKDMSKALTMFFMQSYFDNIGTDELATCITDGANDQGIDAIYIEELEDGTNMVNVIQTKLCMSNTQFREKRFKGNDADKLMSKFDDFIVKKKFHEHANSLLQAKLDEIERADNKKYRIILLTTALPPARDATERMLSEVKQYNKTAEFVTLDFVGLRKLTLMLPSLKEQKIDFNLRMEGNVVDSHAGKARVIVGRAQTRRIADIVKANGDQLFDKNVRIYLKKRNEINKNIYTTASDPDKSKYFFILNNGITIVCNKVSYFHGETSPDITIEGAQIVNGGQTSNSLFEAQRDKILQDTAEVLVRIIESDDPEVINMVTAATNSQTPVKDPDLHSNDVIQKVIKQYIKDKYGYYYETKRNEDQLKAPFAKRIDKESATQAYYAYHYEEPAIAKTSKSKLFSSEYETIFNENLDKDNFFFAYQLLLAMKKLNKLPEVDEYSFYRDAQLTSLALMKHFCPIKNFDELKVDEENGLPELKEAYLRILDVTRSIITDETEKVGAEKFEKRRFFIAPTTLGRIHQQLLKK